MAAGDAEQFSGLTKMYGKMSDQELVELARGMEDLIEVAQSALKGELARRRLSRAVEELEPADALEEELDGVSLPEGYAFRAPNHCVSEFDDEEDASAAALWLKSEGIESQVILPSSGRYAVRASMLAVAPGDAARMAELLAQPIPEEFREMLRNKDEYVVPTCPACGSDEILLEEVEPANKWVCDACGHAWVEDVPNFVA